MKEKSVVVIGGGTGIYSVVTALKQLPIKISTIIAVSDSGGSAGRIRDEFGFPPVGDLRQSLAALADEKSQKAIQQLLLYRFEKGSGLKGHNLGNLILTALQDMQASTTEALEIASQIFRIQGRVIPSTESAVNLAITYVDGTTVVGEHTLDETAPHPKKIASVALTPTCSLNPAAAQAIAQADLVIIGPGDLYASLLAVLVTPGLAQSLKNARVPVAYFLNLMTRHAQTHNMTAKEHVAEIEKILGLSLSHIIINSDPIPAKLLTTYADQHEFPVQNDLQDDPRVMLAPLLEKNIHEQSRVDTVHRSLLRHSSKKILSIISSLLHI
ncbi:MAG: YvcK family protein [bacterium]|nr:YvcK family protein [bacterium]